MYEKKQDEESFSKDKNVTTQEQPSRTTYILEHNQPEQQMSDFININESQEFIDFEKEELGKSTRLFE